VIKTNSWIATRAYYSKKKGGEKRGKRPSASICVWCGNVNASSSLDRKVVMFLTNREGGGGREKEGKKKWGKGKGGLLFKVYQLPFPFVLLVA